MHKLFRISLFVLMVLCGLGLVGITAPSTSTPGLKLTKTAPEKVPYGEPVKYALTCTNGGEDSAKEVVIQDILPNGGKFIASSASHAGNLSGNVLTFKVASIGVGKSVKITYKVRFPNLNASVAKTDATVTSGSALATARNRSSATAPGVSTQIVGSNVSTADASNKIVFFGYMPNAANYQMYLMNSDATGLTQISFDSNRSYSSPVLSPDGSKIAYLSSSQDTNFTIQLFVINAAPISDTNPPLQLTNSDTGVPPAAGDYIGWSPNGKQIVYSRGGVPYITDLTPQSATHQPVQITNTGSGQQFAFSPDGSQLAYSYFVGGTTNNIATISLTRDANGLVTGCTDSPHQRSSSAKGQYNPTWSPDGTTIAFVQDVGTSSNPIGDIFITPSDKFSTSPTQLTAGQQVSFRNISWSPDGSLITYEGRDEGRAPDGTLTNGGLEGVYTIKPQPQTDVNGANYPVFLTGAFQNNCYDPSFAQVSGGGGTNPTPTPTGTTTPTATPSPTPTQAPSSPVYVQKTLLTVNGQTTNARIPVAPADQVVYRLKITNEGTTTATNVVVRDPLPDAVTGVSAAFSDANGNDIGGIQGGTLKFETSPIAAVFSLSELAPGEVVYGIVTVKVGDLDNGTSFVNVATLTADNLPTVTSSVTLFVNANPNLSLTKSVRLINNATPTSNQTVIPGDSILYVLHYINSGKGAASHVKITDPLPANTRGNGVYFSDADGKQIDAPTGGGVTLTSSEGTAIYDIPHVSPGGEGYVTLVAVVKPDAASKAKQISNVNYTLMADGGVNLTGLPAITNPLRAPITVAKRVQLVNGKPYSILSSQVRVGDVLTYQIDISNPQGNGATTAKNLVVTDFLPQGTTIDSAGTGTYVAASPPYVQFKFPSLAFGGAKTMTFSVKIGTSVVDKVANVDYGVVIDGFNRRFTGAEVDTPVFNPSATSFTVSKTATVIETGSSTQVAPGQNIRYTLTVTNGSNETVTGVSVSDTLPTNTLYNIAYLGTPNAPITGAAPVYNPSGRIVSYSIPSIPSKSSVSMTLEVQVLFGTTGKTIVNSSYAASGHDSGGNNFNATGTPVSLTLGTKGPAAPNLQISKTASVNGATVKKVAGGDTFVYTFNYSNGGSGKTAVSTARGVTIRETLPQVKIATGTTLPTIVGSSAPYTSDSSGNLFWKVSDMGSGTSGSLTLTLKVPITAKSDGLIVNSSYEIDAANIAGVGAKGTSLSLNVTAAKLPKLGIVLAAEVADNQLLNGKLHQGSRIDYTLVARNSGDGTAAVTVIGDDIPAGTAYVSNSANFDASSPIQGTVGTATDDDDNVTSVGFVLGNFAKGNIAIVHFSVVVRSDAPTTLTKISNSGFIAGLDSFGNNQRTDSNVVDELVTITAPTPTPTPGPARLTLASTGRPTAVVRNTAFTTTLIVENGGGQPAHNILLQYNIDTNAEQVTGFDQGGTRQGVGTVPNRIVWDGTGSDQAAKFATLNPGDFIVVHVTSKSSTRKNQTLITGAVADVHERSGTGSGPVTNPVLRMNIPNTTVGDTLPTGTASLGTASTVSTAGNSLADRFVAFIQAIGASIQKAFSGGYNIPKPVQDRLNKVNFSTSTTSSSAGEDSSVQTFPAAATALTVKVTAILRGGPYRVEGPASLIKLTSDATVISRDGAGIVAQGGGNAISVGDQFVSDYYAKVISNDGGTLQNTVLYNGGAGTLITQDGNGLIGQDGNGIVGQGGGNAVPIPSGLIGQDGNGLLAKGQLIGQDGNGLASKPQAGLISQDGNGIVGQGGGNIVAQGGGNLTANGVKAQASSSSQGNPTVANLQGNNLYTVTRGN